MLLGDPDVDVRRVAAFTIGLVGDQSATACLAQALHDVDLQVNQMAEYGLMSIWFRERQRRRSHALPRGRRLPG